MSVVKPDVVCLIATDNTDLFSKFGMVRGISSRSSNHVQVCLEDNHKVETMPNPNRSSRESSIDQFECH